MNYARSAYGVRSGQVETPTWCRRLKAYTLACAFLSACTAQTIRPPLLPILPNGTSIKEPLAYPKAMIYVCESTQVKAFPQGQLRPRPFETITDGIDTATGCFVDAGGNLYVVNSHSQQPDEVLVYPPRKVRPSKAYSKGFTRVYGGVVDDTGDLYLSCESNTRYLILEFARGSMTPTAHAELHRGAGGLMTDHSGNIYTALFNEHGPLGQIVRFAPGLTQPRRIATRISSSYFLLDKHTDIVFVSLSGREIAISKLGSKGPPFRIITSPDFFPVSSAMTLSGDERYLYAVSHGKGVSAWAFRYKAGKVFTRSLDHEQGSQGNLVGVAAYPRDGAL
jgi:hypothetical protein